MTWHKRVPLLVVAAVLATTVLTSSAVADNPSGFKTQRPSMLTAVMSGVEVTPLLTVGDVLPSGYRY